MELLIDLVLLKGKNTAKDLFYPTGLDRGLPKLFFMNILFLFVVLGERTVEGFYRVNCGIDQAISRGLSYAPYADLIWCETDKPDINEARRFANSLHEQFPGLFRKYLFSAGYRVNHYPFVCTF